MANLKSTFVDDSGDVVLAKGTTLERPSNPEPGMVRFNTDTNQLEWYDADSSSWMTSDTAYALATGGIVADRIIDGTTYRVHHFTTPGTYSLNVSKAGFVEYLIVGAGGGGASGFNSDASGGGGGAGAFIQGQTFLSVQSYTVEVGAGGAGGDANGSISSDNNRTTPGERDGQYGQDSFAFGITANGGGGGATFEDTIGFSNGNASAGGNGGAGSGDGDADSIRSSGGQYGNDGGLEDGTGQSNESTSCGGGGGAGSRGGDGKSSTTGGYGGQGMLSSITGDSVYYSAGGAGGSTQGTVAKGGLGGGGDAGSPPNTNGGNNGEDGGFATGSGGGGGSAGSTRVDGGRGGSGIVVVRYKINKNETSQAQITNNGVVLDLDAASFNSYNGKQVWQSKNEGPAALIETELPNKYSRSNYSYFDFETDSITLSKDAIPTGSLLTFEVWNYGIEERQSSLIEARIPLDGDGGDRTLNVHLPWSNGDVYFDCGGDRLHLTNISQSDYQGWHHWVFVKNANTGVMKVYLDGAEKGSRTGATGTISPTGFARIGDYADGFGDRYHRAYVASIKIYNIDLTADQAAENFEATRWKFGV